MATIDGGDLMMAIQAIDETMQRLWMEINAAGEDADPELQLLELAYWKTARKLEEAYREECIARDLPPYEQLVQSSVQGRHN